MRAMTFVQTHAYENKNKKVEWVYHVVCVLDSSDGGCYGAIISSREDFETTAYFSMPVILAVFM